MVLGRTSGFGHLRTVVVAPVVVSKVQNNLSYWRPTETVRFRTDCLYEKSLLEDFPFRREGRRGPRGSHANWYNLVVLRATNW